MGVFGDNKAAEAWLGMEYVDALRAVESEADLMDKYAARVMAQYGGHGLQGVFGQREPEFVFVSIPWPGNAAHAKACKEDCIARGETPIVPRMVYADEDASERGRRWIAKCDVVAVYTEPGLDGGMKKDIEHASACGVRVEFRSLAGKRDDETTEGA